MSRARGREEAAHRYADAGWHVFPCEPGGKRPIPEHGFKEATTDHRQIERWWRAEPRSNLAIATGAPGPDVVDVDKHKDGNGFGAWGRLKQAGLTGVPMAVLRTPSGGFHAFYQGTEQRNGHLPGVYVDFRSQGGYVVASPSRIAGRDYEVARTAPSTDTFDWGAAKHLLAPQKQRQAYRAPERSPGAQVDYSGMARWLASQAEGSRNRNEALFWASCRVVEAGDTHALGMLADAARATGLDDREIGRTIASAQRTACAGAATRPFEHSQPPVATAAADQPHSQAEAEALPARTADGGRIMTVRAAAVRPRILAELAERPGQTAYEIAAALGYGKPDSNRVAKIVTRLWERGDLAAGTVFRPLQGRPVRSFAVALAGTPPRPRRETPLTPLRARSTTPARGAVASTQTTARRPRGNAGTPGSQPGTLSRGTSTGPSRPGSPGTTGRKPRPLPGRCPQTGRRVSDGRTSPRPRAATRLRAGRRRAPRVRCPARIPAAPWRGGGGLDQGHHRPPRMAGRAPRRRSRPVTMRPGPDASTPGPGNRSHPSH